MACVFRSPRGIPIGLEKVNQRKHALVSGSDLQEIPCEFDTARSQKIAINKNDIELCTTSILVNEQ